MFPSSEGSLTEWKSAGFAGCISATTNITGRLSQIAWSDPESREGRDAAAAAMAIRTVLGGFPLMASVKAALSRNDWRTRLGAARAAAAAAIAR